MARVGGDAFLALLLGMNDLTDSAAVAEGIRTSVRHPVPTLDGPPVVDITGIEGIGVTLAIPRDDVDTLTHRADTAMYETNRRGADQVDALPPGARAATGGAGVRSCPRLGQRLPTISGGIECRDDRFGVRVPRPHHR